MQIKAWSSVKPGKVTLLVCSRPVFLSFALVTERRHFVSPQLRNSLHLSRVYSSIPLKASSRMINSGDLMMARMKRATRWAEKGREPKMMSSAHSTSASR